MNQQNNENSAAIFAIAVVMAVIITVAAVLFMAAAFICFVMTIVCLFAWNKPIVIRNEVWVEPVDARSFVRRGLAGAFLLPAFAIFCEIVLGVYVRGDALPYLIMGGYIAGSLGIEILIQQVLDAEKAQQVEVLPPQIETRAQSQQQARLDRPPFEFADWDDEGPGR
ncbi:hypothetical protein ACQW02_06805 [Humitalea sp. 24SJ18S-53]|uniref:hypothetical protein n=1 Tax=Humitalea sp. 24SJ18S-53 TaxID=3422307 RepID=UPI003D6754BB